MEHSQNHKAHWSVIQSMNNEKMTFMVVFSAGDDEMEPDTVTFTWDELKEAKDFYKNCPYKNVMLVINLVHDYGSCVLTSRHGSRILFSRPELYDNPVGRILPKYADCLFH